MKKYLISLFALILILSTPKVKAENELCKQTHKSWNYFVTPFNETQIKFFKNVDEPFRRPWWATLFVDLTGALGGGASGAQLCSGNPWCIGGGAIIGGVGASVARGTSINSSDYIVITNPKNRYDYIGEMHNKIAMDYFSSISVFNRIGFTSFLNLNKAEYGLGDFFNLDIVNKEITNAEVIDFGSLSTETAVNLLLKSLPVSVNKKSFSNSMTRLLNTGSVSEFNSIIIEEEDKLLAMEGLSDSDLIVLSAMLSTMRYSANLWN